MVATEPVSSADELLRRCREVGYPVVLKGVVPGVTHKADQQLVYTDVTGDEDARAIDTRVGVAGPIAQRVDRALRARPRDMALRGLVVRHLADGLRDASGVRARHISGHFSSSG